VAAIIRNVFPDDTEEAALAVAWCESRWGQHPNTCVPWNRNKGPFQIWEGHAAMLAEHGITDLCDVEQNARAA